MSGTPKFSLSFSKKIENKNLNPSVIRNDAPKDQKETTLLIESIEENKIIGDEQVEEELVIPMIEQDRSAIFKKLSEKALKLKLLGIIDDDDKDDSEIIEDDSTSNNIEITSNKKPLTLEEQAEAAIIEESKQGTENWKNRSQKDNLSIPVGMPSEEDSLTTIGKESNLDEYDQIGVENFGGALLRGMGWKKKEGIGGKMGKRVVEIVEPTARQIGQSDFKAKEISVGNKDEELEIKNGSYIFIHSGHSRGSYGIVESVDEDHILVRRSMTNDVVREVELNIQVVNLKEFKDSSRVINKEMYDEYKAKEGNKGKEEKEMEDESENKKNKDKDRHENDMKVYSNYKKDDKKEYKDKFSGQTKIIDIKEEETEKYDNESSKKNKNSNYGNKYNRASHDENIRSNKEDGEERKEEFKEKQESNKYAEREDSYYSKKDYKDSDDRKYKDSRHKSDYPQNKDNNYSKDSKDRKYCYDQLDTKDDYSKERVNEKSGSNKYNSDRYEDKNSHKGKRSGYDEYKEVKKHKVDLPAMPWIRENLRVRLINKNFKGGKYHKEKVIVCSIETAESCECITDDGRILREVNPAWLETVIPKKPPQIVLIVKGQQKGQKGRILELHKSQERASIQMLNDDKDIVKIHYDNICEYVRR